MSVDFDVVDALAGFAEDLHGEGNFAMRLHDAVKKLKEERDALKADLDVVDSDLQLAVKRLTAEVERARSKGFTEGHAAGRQAAFDGEVTNADIQRAFQRGAETMREAAALEVRGYSVTVTDPLGRRVKLGADGLGALADSIRAMPIPEDK